MPASFLLTVKMLTLQGLNSDVKMNSPHKQLMKK